MGNGVKRYIVDITYHLNRFRQKVIVYRKHRKPSYSKYYSRFVFLKVIVYGVKGDSLRGILYELSYIKD